MSLFVTFEGIEGSGKSTQIRLLGDALRAAGTSVLTTHEPGATAVGKALRAVLLDPAHTELTPLTELLLYCADRHQHVAECIRPALAASTVVLCDRFSDSTIAYQGYGREIDLALVRSLDASARDGVAPALTFVLDCPVTEGLERARRRSGAADRLEAEPLDFHERIRTAFLALAREAPERYVVVDSTQPIERIHAQIAAETMRRLGAG